MPKSQAELDSAPAELPAVDTPSSDDAANAENVSHSVFEPDHSLDAPGVPFIARRSHQRLGIESLFVRLSRPSGS